METHNSAPVRLFLMVLAVVLFGLATFGWPAPIDPYRTKLIGGGLFCWSLSTFF